MRLFTNRLADDPLRLILTPVEAARQQAARRLRNRLARDAAARLLAVRQQAQRNDR